MPQAFSALNPPAAVQPERPRLYHADPEQPGYRPGIAGEARPDLVLMRGRD
jgi:hypothetical protein